ncbi:MAG: hypothetical protein AVDCRST_MAG89-1760, partial [uncultured Gemmatimonadetes bacterium]
DQGKGAASPSAPVARAVPGNVPGL